MTADGTGQGRNGIAGVVGAGEAIDVCVDSTSGALTFGRLAARVVSIELQVLRESFLLKYKEIRNSTTA